MNRLILIGNGFDLAHGLRTSYKDFIEWYWDYVFKKLRLCNCDVWVEKLCSFTLKNQGTWASFLQMTISIIKPPKGLDFINNAINDKTKFEVKFEILLEQILKSCINKGWVDIENDYYTLLCKSFVESSSICVKDLNEQLSYTKGLLAKYLFEVQKKVLLTDIVKDTIKESMFSSAESREVSNRYLRVLHNSIDDSLSIDNLMLLNFNYTEIADQYVKDSSCETIHIHGNLQDVEGMIFGYGDELDENYKRILNLNDNEYLRNSKSVRYMETDNYRRMLSFIESAPYQIYIMGHSCGNSDRTLLNTLFEHKNCVSIKPFFYKKENGSDNYMEIVQNISRNFTDMKLMRDRVVNKKYCQPLPQN